MRPTLNLFSPQTFENPYPLYAELRANAPVVESEPFGWWVLTRYEDVVYVLKNPDIFSSAVEMAEIRRFLEGERLAKALPLGESRTSLVRMDPPDHTRLRKLLTGAFTPKAIARLEPRINAIVRESVDHILEKGSFDMMEELAIPLPVTIIAEMLGVDPARRDDFKRWSNATITSQAMAGLPLSEAEEERLIQSRLEFAAYFRQMIDERRKKPREDLISDLVRAEVESETLTAEEVFAMVILLLIAGNETTTNLIGNGTLMLLEHPEAERQLRENPSLIPAFLEEVLRFEGPVRFLVREATRDVTIAGVDIAAGEKVVTMLDAANRDPAQFADPERFDITREPRTHVAFGYGIHFCVGAPLSRLEGRIAFEELLRRVPAFHRVDERPDRRPTFALHGLSSLRLALSSSARAA